MQKGRQICNIYFIWEHYYSIRIFKILLAQWVGLIFLVKRSGLKTYAICIRIQQFNAIVCDIKIGNIVETILFVCEACCKRMYDNLVMMNLWEKFFIILFWIDYLDVIASPAWAQAWALAWNIFVWIFTAKIGISTRSETQIISLVTRFGFI